MRRSGGRLMANQHGKFKAEKRPTNLVGERFGRLVVHQFVRKDANWNTWWLCQCDCGGSKTVARYNLVTGNTSSCGCLQLASIKRVGASTKRHGMWNTPEYKAWQMLRHRCYNPKAAGYKNYGGRGIKVCERWQSFDAFIEDMGRRPAPDLSIDRINNDGNYEPSNCRWATKKEQVINRRPSSQWSNAQCR